MFKKLISTMLCLMMLVSVIGVSAQIDEVKDTDGTTVIKTTYTDNFETEDGYTDGDKYNKYGSSGKFYNNGIFAKTPPEATTNPQYCEGWITSGAGTNDSMALVVQPASSNYGTKSIMTKDLDIADASKTKVYELSYDVKLSDLTGSVPLGNKGSRSDSSNLIILDKNGTVRVREGSSFVVAPRMTTEANKWYHVVIVVSGMERRGWIRDEAGTYGYSERELASGATRLGLEFHSSKTQTVTLDNVKLVEFDPAKVAPSIVTAPVVSNVLANTETVSVTLDQMLDTSAKPTLTKAGGTPQDCTIAMDKTKPYTYTITLPTMEGGAAYTLDLSGLKNKGGATVGETAKYSFTTAAAYITPDVDSFTVGDNEDKTAVALDTKTMTVNFTKPMPNYPTGGVTLTSNKVNAPNISATVAASNDNQTYTFTWEEKLKSNTTYTVDLSEFGDVDSQPPVTASVSFTTLYNGIVKVTDTFESGANGGKSAYNMNQSTSYLLTTGSSNTSNTIYNSDGGKVGKALQLISKSATSGSIVDPLKTVIKHQPATETVGGETLYEQFVATYHVKFPKIAKADGSALTAALNNGGAQIRFAAGKSITWGTTIACVSSNASGTPYIGRYSLDYGAYKEAQLNTDRWYNVVWSFDGTNQTFALIDDTTKELVWSTTKDCSDQYSAGEAITIYAIDGGQRNNEGYRYNVDQEYWVDEFTLWKIKPWEVEDHALELTSATGENGTYTLAFNQPVMATKDDFKVYLGSDKQVDFDIDCLYPDFCTQTITVKDLAPSTTYTLNYSGLKALSGIGGQETNGWVTEPFTTSAETGFSLSFVNAVEIEGNNASFKLYSGEATTATVYVAYYADGQLVGVKAPGSPISIGTGETETVTVPVVEDPYDTIKVFAWNGGLSPLMRVYNQIAE